MILATIDPYILAFSFVTVAATVFMGFWSAKKSKTAGDFFVAGRSVSVGWNASAISGEYLSAASFMGIAGMVMSSGYDALWYPVCYACGYLFLLLFIAGPLRRFGAYTIPDFAEGRYDSPLFRKIAVCFVLFIGFFYTMPQMKGAGVTLAYIFPGLPYWVGVVLVGAVITLNVALGGMKGITLVQAFQYWIKMFAISAPIFVLMAVYGGYGKQLEENSPKAEPATTGSLELFLPQTWKITAINGNSNELFLKLNEGKSAVARSLGKPSLQAGNFDVFSALRLFAANHSLHRMLVAQSAPGYPQMTNPISITTISTVEKWEQDVRVGLRSNGVDVIVASDALVVVPIAKHAEYEAEYRKRGMSVFEPEEALLRKPLPEKAPADSTWLSPFGPLTTKAAKAAKPHIRFDGQLETETVQPMGKTIGELVDRAATQVKALTYTNTSRYADGTYSAFDFSRFCFIEMWRSDRVNLSKELSFRRNPALREIAINWSQPEGMVASELSKKMNETLSAAGVTVVRERSVFTSFPTKDATIVPVNPRPYSLLYTYSLIIALVCGTAGLPHILVRFYTNPDGVAAKRTTMWVMILIGIFYVFPPVFGVLGRNLMPELYNGLTGVKGTDGIVLKLPTILREKYGALGSILSGVTCAGAFAAFMSTFSGLLVSMTGALAHDVYGRMLKPKSTSEQRLRAFKVCAVLIGGIAIVLGCFVEPLEINFMVGQAFAIAAASYFPLLFMSVWWRGMTMRGAAIGMLTGGLCALFAVALTNVSNLASDKGPMGQIFAGFAPMNNFWAGHPLLRILCEQPAIWTVPLAIGLMIVISKFTHKDVPSDVRAKMLVLHAPEKLGLKQEYIQEHQPGH